MLEILGKINLNQTFGIQKNYLNCRRLKCESLISQSDAQINSGLPYMNQLVVGCDCNAHHTAWGSTNCNGRGEALFEFLNSTTLDIFNRGNEPTFCTSVRREVIGVTLGSYGLMDSITDWEVSSEASLSDHRHILFTLRGSSPVILFRNPRGTNRSPLEGAWRRSRGGVLR
jgi:hypothetical protein